MNRVVYILQTEADICVRHRVRGRVRHHAWQRVSRRFSNSVLDSIAVHVLDHVWV